MAGKKLSALDEASYTPWMRELATRKTRKRVPKLLDVAALPALHDGAVVLPEPVVIGAIKRMAELGPDEPAPLLAALRAWATPESAGGFGLALLKAWAGPGKAARGYDWLLVGGGRLGGATAGGWLVKEIGRLGSSRRRPDRDRARRMLAALEIQGDDEAARQLMLLTRHSGVQILTDLEAAVGRVARARGVSRAALEDALLPLEETLLALTTPKAVPSFIKLKALPRLRYRDGRELDLTLTGGIIRAMVQKGGGHNRMWRSVEDRLQALLDPASAEAFANALLAAWGAKRFHGTYSWVMDGLRSFGGDTTALALKPTLQAWSTRRATDTERQRAIAAMDIFEKIGTETALLVLVGLGARNTRPSVYDRARGVIRAAASRRGLSVGQLEDRIAPDCGLDAGGSRSFDYGPRQFTLVFDEEFRPRVRDSEGGRHDALPKPAAGDDPDKVAAAQADWSLVSQQLAEILDVQTMRLQRAMISGRRWAPDEWRRYLLGHPLMVNYARRLVWGVYGADGALVGTFRADEGGGLLDRDDEEVALGEDQTIGLVHPATLPAADRAGWGEHLADYEIITPFPQLERPVYAPDAAEAEQHALTRFAEVRINARHLYDTMIGLQWDRDTYGGWRGSFFKLYREAGLFVTVNMQPGYSAGGVEWADAQSLPTVTFEDRDGRYGAAVDKEKHVRLGAVDPVIFSEVVQDIHEALEG